MLETIDEVITRLYAENKRLREELKAVQKERMAQARTYERVVKHHRWIEKALKPEKVLTKGKKR